MLSSNELERRRENASGIWLGNDQGSKKKKCGWLSELFGRHTRKNSVRFEIPKKNTSDDSSTIGWSSGRSPSWRKAGWLSFLGGVFIGTYILNIFYNNVKALHIVEKLSSLSKVRKI